MRRAALIVALVLLPLGGGAAEEDRAWSERHRLFRVGAHQGLNYWSTAMQITLFMVESGIPEWEMGHNNPVRDLRGLACPCMAYEDRNIIAGTLAIQKSLARFVLSDPYRRKEFFRYFAAYYHGGGGGGR